MPKSNSNDPGPTTAENDSFCDSCRQSFHRRGFAAHRAACLKKAEQRKKDTIFYAKVRDLEAQKQLREGM